MTAASSTTAAYPRHIAIEMFRGRASARAHLYSIGDLDLHDAMDAVHEHAERHRQVAQHGQDAVQAIVAEAFWPVRAAGEAS